MASKSGAISLEKCIFSGPVDMSKNIDLNNLKNKTILITGGASGFGAAFFEELAGHGANVIIGDINVAGGEALVAKIRQHTNNSNHHFLPLNVTKWPEQVTFFKQAAKLSPHGGIDCVIANAGICDANETAKFENPPDYSTMENPPPPSMRTVDINLDGVLYTTTLALSYLVRNPGSQSCSLDQSTNSRDRHLIFVSSIAGTIPLPSQSYYAAAKHGVVGLFRSLRLTSPIAHGIRVNMINPYFVDTPILGPLGPFALAGGGMAKLEDVVAAITRLIADQSIIGRGLMIGARVTPEQVEQVGLGGIRSTNHASIWDFYAEDFYQADIFSRRIVGLTNMVSSARGYFATLYDSWFILKRLLGKYWAKP